jgi:hypothetical protein
VEWLLLMVVTCRVAGSDRAEQQWQLQWAGTGNTQFPGDEADPLAHRIHRLSLHVPGSWWVFELFCSLCLVSCLLFCEVFPPQRRRLPSRLNTRGIGVAQYSVWLRTSWPGYRALIPGRGKRIFSLTSVSRRAVGPAHPASCPVGTGGRLSPGVMRGRAWRWPLTPI